MYQFKTETFKTVLELFSHLKKLRTAEKQWGAENQCRDTPILKNQKAIFTYSDFDFIAFHALDCGNCCISIKNCVKVAETGNLWED
jgi:hypothetical protein